MCPAFIIRRNYQLKALKFVMIPSYPPLPGAVRSVIVVCEMRCEEGPALQVPEDGPRMRPGGQPGDGVVCKDHSYASHCSCCNFFFFGCTGVFVVACRLSLVSVLGLLIVMTALVAEHRL